MPTNTLACSVVAACILALGAPAPLAAQDPAIAPGLALDDLLERFDPGAPPNGGSVELDAWIESEGERDEVVVVVQPRGEYKLVGDPGITVTPTEQPGVEWLVPLPYRYVDPAAPYLTPPATLRLPFRANGGDAPLEMLVEYAYCVVEYQCFYGEETLTVTERYD